MKSVLMAILSAFLGFGCATGQNAQKQKKIEQAELYFSYGTSKLTSGDYPGALENLLSADQLKPNDSKINNNLGMAYYLRGDKASAQKHIELALRLDPKNTDALVNMASLNLEQGKLATAEKLYKKILKDLVYDRQFRTHYNLGIIEFKKGRYQKAIDQYSKSIKVNPDYCPPYYEQGRIYAKLNRNDKALEVFNEGTKGQCYNNPAPQYQMGLILLKMEKYARAKAKFELIINKFKKSDYFPLAKKKLAEIDTLKAQVGKNIYPKKANIKSDYNEDRFERKVHKAFNF